MILLVVALLAGVGWWLASRAGAKRDETRTVRVERPVCGDLVEIVSARGEVAPKKRVSISARVSARIVASRQRVAYAQRVCEAEVRQFDLGLRTSTDVLEAQASLADARSAEILALTECQIAQVDLAVATGSTLAASRVRWTPTDIADCGSRGAD